MLHWELIRVRFSVISIVPNDSPPKRLKVPAFIDIVAEDHERDMTPPLDFTPDTISVS